MKNNKKILTKTSVLSASLILCDSRSIDERIEGLFSILSKDQEKVEKNKQIKEYFYCMVEMVMICKNWQEILIFESQIKEHKLSMENLSIIEALVLEKDSENKGIVQILFEDKTELTKEEFSLQMQKDCCN